MPNRNLEQTVGIIVGGRFHSDHLALSCKNLNYSYKLFTSLPKNRFPGLERDKIYSTIWPELVFRSAMKLGIENTGDLYKIKHFGKWVSQQLKNSTFDILFSWSSFGKESFEKKVGKRQILIRDSAHIEVQMEILKTEYEKYGFKFPNRDAIVSRELAEYEISDEIIVLSDYAKNSFLDKNISDKPIHKLPLGVDTRVFTQKARWNTTLPLKIVYFGTLSIQKGIQYLLQATKGLKQIELHLVGHLDPDFKDILSMYPHAHWYPPMRQRELSTFLQEMDIFVFPTLHDGFGQTLIQAMAVGLACIATNTCGASENISNGKDGFIIPPKSTWDIQKCLELFLEDPQLIQSMGNNAIQKAQRLSWKKYEENLESILKDDSDPQVAKNLISTNDHLPT